MPEFTIAVHALGPLLFRDARPFSASGDESRARSLELPAPTTLAGLVRTTLGRIAGLNWSDPADVLLAQRITVQRCGFAVTTDGAAPVPVAPCPASVLVVRRGDRFVLEDLRPAIMGSQAGSTLPKGMLPLVASGPEKPERGFGWWLEIALNDWLAGELSGLPATVAPPLVEQRVQIGTLPGSRQAADGMLFTVDYRSWESANASGQPVRWMAQADIDFPADLTIPDEGMTQAVFGGEQRPVTLQWRSRDMGSVDPPSRLMTALTATTRVKLYLRTPGLFVGGWRPAWVDRPQALHPELTGARLVGAAVGRPETVSGWSYDRSNFGPKPTMWAAPSGSTYFFELTQPLSRQAVKDLVNIRVCDAGLDDGIGYGQARWGVWE